MMDKFNSKTDNDATGASGKKSFLTKHTSVVGVASHDVLYSTGALDKDPFSREPYQLKKAKGRRSASSDDENGTNKDGGGSISTDEIKQVLSFGQNLDEDVIQMIIKQVDENGDGEISYEEFAAMMLKNIQD